MHRPFWMLVVVGASGCGGQGDDSDTEEITDAVYVSTDGDDAAVGTRQSPKASLEAAMEAAAEALVGVRVASGSYPASGLVVPVSLEGGYDAATWEHTPESSTTTLTTSGMVLLVAPVSGIGSLTFAHFTVSGGGAVRLPGDAAWTYSVHDLDLPGIASEIVVESGSDAFASIERVAVEDLTVQGSVTVADVTVRGETRAMDAELTLSDSSVGHLYVTSAEGDDFCLADVRRVQATRLVVSSGGPRCAVAFLDSTLDASGGISVEGADVQLVGNTVDVAVTSTSGDRGFGVAQGGVLTLVGNTVRVSGFGTFATGLRAESQGEARLAHNVFDVSAGTTAVLFSLFNGEVLAVNNAFSASGSGANHKGFSGSGAGSLSNNAFTGVACYADNACAFVDFAACAWTGCTAASANLEVTNPGYTNAAAGDFHISASSPLHDAGTDPGPAGFAAALVGTDVDGDTRPQGLGWDIGIDEVDE